MRKRRTNFPHSRGSIQAQDKFVAISGLCAVRDRSGAEEGERRQTVAGKSAGDFARPMVDINTTADGDCIPVRWDPV
jgi:hypothetical protein